MFSTQPLRTFKTKEPLTYKDIKEYSVFNSNKKAYKFS